MSRSRLDTVVRVRGLQERIARGAVSVAHRDVAEQVRDRSRAAAAVDHLVATDPAAGRPSDAAAFIGRRRVLDQGTRLVAEADLAVSAARVHVEHSITEWKATAQRLEGVERLEARLHAVALELDGRRESAQNDDLTTARWRRRDQVRPRQDERMDGIS